MTSRLDKIWFHYTTKGKFLSNSSNNSALVSMISAKRIFSNISSICCGDDADTTIVKESLQYSLPGNVDVVAEDVDILIILIHLFYINIYKEIRILTSKGHYSVNEIVNNLPPDEKLWILFCHSFSGCDTFSSIFGVSKEKFYPKICSGQLRQIIDKFQWRYRQCWNIDFSAHIQHACEIIIHTTFMQIQRASKGRSRPPRKSATDQWFCNTAFSQSISTDTGLDTFKEYVQRSKIPWVVCDKCRKIWTHNDFRWHCSSKFTTICFL